MKTRYTFRFWHFIYAKISFLQIFSYKHKNQQLNNARVINFLQILIFVSRHENLLYFLWIRKYAKMLHFQSSHFYIKYERWLLLELRKNVSFSSDIEFLYRNMQNFLHLLQFIFLICKLENSLELICF